MTATALKSVKRIHSFDHLRSIMMLLGIVLHSTEVYLVSSNEPWPKDPNSTSMSMDYLEYLIHMFRMPIFFIMSGFFGGMLFYVRGAKEMVKNRISRIFYPFVVFLFILYPITAFSLEYVKDIFLGIDNPAAILDWSTLFIPRFTLHLWFLYYLIMISLFTVFLTLLIPRNSKFIGLFNRFFRFLFKSSYFRVPILALIIFILLVLVWNLSPPTPLDWILDVPSFLFYFFFYAFGWFLFKSKELIAQFEHNPIANVILATLLFTANFLYSDSLGDIEKGMINAFVMAFYIYGIMGVFSKFYNKGSKTVRYISASSYWVYLIHIPFTILVPGMLADIWLPAEMKFLTTLLVTTLICFVTYHLFVKSTFIGVFLNGKKFKM